MKRTFERPTLAAAVVLAAVLFPALVPSAVSGQDTSGPELEQLDFATGLFQKGFYDMSIAEYEKYLSRYPKGEFVQESILGVAENNYFKGDYPESEKHYQRYLSTFPKGKFIAVVNLRLGEIANFGEQFEEAEEYLERIKPEDFTERALQQTWHYYLAQAQRALGKTKEAEENLKAAIALDDQKQFTAPAFLELGNTALDQKLYREAADYYAKARELGQTDEIRALGAQKQGEALYHLGEYNAAMPLFTEVIKKYPDLDISYDALANRFLCYYQVKDYIGLIKVFLSEEKEYKPSPRLFAAVSVVISAFMELERYEEALALTDEMTASEQVTPEDKHSALLKKAEILSRQKEFDAAVKALEEAAAVKVSDPAELLYQKAELFYRAGEYAKAAGQYTLLVADYLDSPFADGALYGLAYSHKSLDNTDEAVIRFEQYVKTGIDENKRADSLYHLALLYRNNGDMKKAIQSAQEYLTKYKDKPGYERVSFMFADLYSSDGQTGASGDALDQYLKQFPEGEFRQEALFLKGYNAQSEKKFDEALEVYRQVKPEETDREYWIMAQKNMAAILLDRDENAEAATVYDRLVTQVGGDVISVQSYFWLAELHLQEGRSDDALRVLEQLEKRGGLTKEEVKGLAFFRGEADRLKNNCGGAMRSFDAVLSGGKLNGYSGPAYLGKGLCLSEGNEHEKAREALVKAIETNQEDHATTMKARMALADLEIKLGRDEDALKYYLLVGILYRDEDTTPLALLKAGGLLEKLDRSGEALQTYQEIIEKFPESPTKDEAAERIRAIN